MGTTKTVKTANAENKDQYISLNKKECINLSQKREIL